LIKVKLQEANGFGQRWLRDAQISRCTIETPLLDRFDEVAKLTAIEPLLHALHLTLQT
jgi:hypothetical protein